MESRWKVIAKKVRVALIITVMMVVVALAHAQRQPRRTPQRNEAGVPLKKTRPEAGDPLAKVAGIAAKPATGLSHYTFRLRSFDGTPLAASYYPSRLGNSAPVVMLIHETGRSRKDFEDPVQELKGQGLAAHLQGLGYAVLSMDRRWQGQNPRRAITVDERPKLLEDLQAAYFFLVDRHNRGDLNLEKFGVIALGDGANLVAAWAKQPGAAITIEGKSSDLSALALISPNPEGFGYILARGLVALTPRVPLLLIAGERDTASKDAVQSVRQAVQRVRLSKIELFPSALRGYKLLRLEPKITSALFHFLETTLKNRPVEWEPKYNLTPVTFGDPQLVKNDRQVENTKNNAKEAPKNPQKKVEAPQKNNAESDQLKGSVAPKSQQSKSSDKVDSSS